MDVPQFFCQETRRELALGFETDPLIVESTVLKRRADNPHVDLEAYRDAWEFISLQFVTADYSVIDAIKLAVLIQHYPLPIIEHNVTLARHLKHFTIPYLAKMLDNAGGAEIEEFRRDQRLETLVRDSIASTKPLPPLRFPGRLFDAMREMEINRQIDEIVDGKPCNDA